MAEKFEETAIIIRQEEIADDIYSMWLHTDQIAAHAKAGQFVSVYCNDGSRLLPRPISICEIDKRMVQSVWCIVWQEKERQNFPVCIQAHSFAL